MFRGKTNNEMLRLIMEVKGKIGNKMMKRGDYTSKHFNESNQFLLRKKDPVTKQVMIYLFMTVLCKRSLHAFSTQ